MHCSYENRVDSLYEGTRAVLREQIVRESRIDECEGVFSVEIPPENLAKSLFRFGQALTKIYDLTFLSRQRTASTFYDDLKSLLFTVLDEAIVDTNYVSPDVPDGKNYPVDFRFTGKDELPVFLFGIPNRDKARLTTITLSYFSLNNLLFDSIIIFENKQEIPRLDLARLSNVAGTQVDSLEAEKDFERKIMKLAA